MLWASSFCLLFLIASDHLCTIKFRSMNKTSGFPGIESVVCDVHAHKRRSSQ